MLYIKYRDANGTNVFGWVEKEDYATISEGCLTVQCEDMYGGSVYCNVDRSVIGVCEIQRDSPIGKADCGKYLDNLGNVIGKYEWDDNSGLTQYKYLSGIAIRVENLINV